MSIDRDSNFKQALWLGIGQFSTFIIAFFSAPILSRYFDEIEYGTYRQILYVFTSLQSLFIIGLPNAFAYFIPRLEKGQQKHLVNRLTFLFFLIGLFLSVVLYVCSGLIADILNNQELEIGLKLFSPFPMFTLPTMGIEGIYTALRKTKTIAIYQMISKLLMFIFIVLPVVIWKGGYQSAIIGWGIASFLTFIYAFYLKRKPYKDVTADIFKGLYKQVFSYTLPLAGAFIAGFFCNSADQFFVSRYFGAREFALFSNGCFSLPIIGMIAGSVKGVLLPLFSKAHHEDRLQDAAATYTNAVYRTSILLLPVLIFCVFFARDLMSAFFGVKYVDSSEFFYFYIIRDFIQIIPYYAILMALGYSKLYMNMHVVGAVLIWTLDFIVVKLFDYAPLIVLISSTFHFICTVIAFVYIKRKSKLKLLSKDLAIKIAKIIFHCVIVLLIVKIVSCSLYSSLSVYYVIILNVITFYLMLLCTSKLNHVKYFEAIIQLIKK